MKEKEIGDITIENARIGMRNFEGREGEYNPAGERNFAVFLDPELAKVLAEDGWNVKWLKPRAGYEDEPDQAFLKVKVRFNNYPPKINVISSKGRTRLDAETVKLLDWAEVETIDVIITPYKWEKGNKSGITAYLKTMWVTLKEDELELKYRNVPDSAASSLFNEDER